VIEPDAKEVTAAYGKLITLVTMRYATLERDHPKLVKLAKRFASNDGKAECLTDLCYNRPGAASLSFPVHNVNGVSYPCISFAIHDLVPLWALYLPKAKEALEAYEIGVL
jgi:hypothetical protein